MILFLPPFQKMVLQREMMHYQFWTIQRPGHCF